jgi:type IV fimbrial biogenesis protein FimT
MRRLQHGKLTFPYKKAREGEMEWRGFTLVELLIVLAVGSILLAIAVPGYGFLVEANRLTAATNNLVVAMHFARSESIKRGVRVSMCTTSNPTAAAPVCDQAAGWHQGWLVFEDSGTRGDLDLQDVLLRIEQDVLLHDISISTTNFSHYVSYLPSGMSQGPNNLGNGKFVLCLEHMERQIIVSMTGRIRLARGSC